MRKLEVFIDGASKGNPGESGFGIVIKINDKIYKKTGGYIGKTTNNVAEYISLIFALIECIPFRKEKIIIKSDSQLLVNQMKGSYKVKEPQLKILNFIAIRLLERYNNIEIVHIPREENKLSDEIANSFIEKRELF